MTPFDVLKTRLQTVQPLPHPTHLSTPEECCQTSIFTSKSSRNPLRIPPIPPGQANPFICLTSATIQSESVPQSQPMNRISSSSLHSYAPYMKAPNGCLHPSKWTGIWGEAISMEEALTRGMIGASQGGTATLVLPAEQGVTGVIGGFWSEIAAVRREAGIKGLWKGVGTTLSVLVSWK